jgi:ketosteroid isomerase-like protein
MAQRIVHHRGLRLGAGLVALGAVFAVSVLAQRDGPHPRRNEQYKRQVEKLEAQWRAAEMNGDADSMDKLLSDDYVGITMAGQVVTKMQQLDRMKSRAMVLSKMDLTDVKVKVVGMNAVVVTSLADVGGMNDGQPIHGTFRSTRVYTRLPNGTWKITNFEATRVGSQPDERGPRDERPPH